MRASLSLSLSLSLSVRASGPHTMLMLHSALQCCAPFLECIEHSVHSKSLALKCTRHSVHSTQWTLSTQCHSPYRHSVLSASIVCGPCSGGLL